MSIKNYAFLCLFVVTNIFRKICEFWRKLKEYIQNLNIFSSVPPSTDEYEIETQRISTRFFFIIFSALLTNLLLYTVLIKVTKTVTVEQPTLVEYAYLNSSYSQSLTCPCSNMSISYENFLNVDYTQHQVCSSIFVDQVWIEYLRMGQLIATLQRTDFRWTSPYTFQALRTICNLINDTIADQLIQFYSNKYVTASVVPQTLFESQTKTLIYQFQSSLTKKFLFSLAMIRDITQVNALVTLLQSNYILFKRPGVSKVSLGTGIRIPCSCSSSFACIRQSIIHYNGSHKAFVIPQFYSGCYAIESLFPSTLRCFYNQECIDDVGRFLPSFSSMNITALNESLPTVYSIDSTIDDIVNNLMIEQWKASYFFENYYNECQPIQCTYILDTNNDMIYIFTRLFGIAGGLITVLKLFVPRSIKFIREKQRQQHVTTSK